MDLVVSAIIDLALYHQSTCMTEPATALYTDLADLPLYNWIELSVSGNMKWLVKDGTVPDDLTEHYETLLNEYQSIVKDTKSQHDHQVKIEYAKLANYIDHVTIAINALRLYGRDEAIITILQTGKPQGLGFERLTYNDLEKDLKLTENYLKMDIVKFEQAKNQLEKMVKAVGDTGVNSKGAFYQEVVSLSKWLGFGIQPKETTVMQYISYLNMLQIEIQANRNKK